MSNREIFATLFVEGFKELMDVDPDFVSKSILMLDRGTAVSEEDAWEKFDLEFKNIFGVSYEEIENFFHD